MGERIGKLAIGLGLFIGMLLVMCLAGKIIQKQAEGNQVSAYDEALAKLGGENKETVSTESADKAEADNKAADNTEKTGKNAGDESTSVNTDNSSEQPDSGTDVNKQDTALDKSEPEKSDEGSTESGSKEDENNDKADKSTLVVAIDAAHQEKADTNTEPYGPGADKKVNKMRWGATGVASGVPEYKLTLQLAVALKAELINRGYQVFMIREKNDVTVSDAERAEMANKNADIVVHIHANADDRPGIKGLMAFYPTEDNAFVKNLSADCKKLGNDLLNGLKLSTGAKSYGTIGNDNLSALNWTKIPASHIEVGYLSNEEEDLLMQTEEYQKQIVTGLADGIDLYFGR